VSRTKPAVSSPTPGDRLAPLERTISLTAMVAYSGATWDWHPMHYDAAYAADAGFPGPVVDGQMLGALMAEHVLDHFGPRASLERLSFRFRAVVVAGETVRIEAEVTQAGDGRVTIEQRVLAGDRLAAEGTAEVRL
jgi:acyl dehydratase